MYRAKAASELNSLHAQAVAILDKAEAAGRDLSESEQQAIDGIAAEFDQQEGSILMHDRIQSARSPGHDSAGRVTRPAPVNGGTAAGVRLPQLRFDGSGTGRRYADMFGNAGTINATRTPFTSLAAMMRCAFQNPLDPRLQISNIQGDSESSGPSAGFGVPVQFSQQLLDRSLEQEVIRPRALVIPMSSSEIDLPAWESDTTGGKRAGLLMQWMAEGATATPQKSKMIKLVLKAHKGAIFAAMTSELLQDTPGGSAMLESAMTAAVASGLDNAFINGSGVGQPLGIISAPATIVQTKESGQATGTLTEANVLKMASRLSPASWARATWLASPTALHQLLVLSQVAGPNAGARTSLLGERDGTLTLLSRPLVVTDACATLSTKGDIILADLSRYIVGLRKDVRIETSIHTFWASDEVGIRVIVRVDGQPDTDVPMKLKDGTNTVSPFVVLETR